MKTQAQHTPGRWQLCLGNCGPYVNAQSPGSDVRVAVCHYSACPEVGSSDECIANARLIASAPELLSVLEDCATVLFAVQSGTANPLMIATQLENCRKAIARAKGGNQ
jgi:hypothetical protein